MSMLETMRRKFDAAWYAERYREFLAGFDGDAFDYYLAEGWRLGHDPNADFCELYYRLENDDVAQALLRGDYSSGWHHYLQHGVNEQRDEVPDHVDLRRFYDEGYFHIDPLYLARTCTIDPARYISAYDFYFTESARSPVDPNERFSERGYRFFHEDVAKALRARNPHMPCGFMHFVVSGMQEGRRICSPQEFERYAGLEDAEAGREALEKNIPRITRPVEFEFVTHIGFYTDPVDVDTCTAEREGMIVIVPDFMPEILFGGYHCLFRILADLQRTHGLALRLLEMKDIEPADAYYNVHRMRTQYPHIHGLFESIEHMPKHRRITVPQGWKVLSYACHTHYLAAMVADATGTLPYFLIQDDESEFHAAGSLRTFIRSAWEIPHAGIYNSAALLEHFRHMRGAHFASDYRWCSFENEIKPLGESLEQFRARHSGKRRRTLVVYARPESHAARNELAIVLLALRTLIRAGTLDRREWRLLGVGSLHYSGLYEICPGHNIDIRPKLPLAEYEDLLKGADVGISLISTPHPGIIHFQMASYGLVTVTNTCADRTAEFLRSCSANIVPAELTLDDMPRRILQAMQASGDLEARHANALAMKPIDYDVEIARVVEFLGR